MISLLRMHNHFYRINNQLKCSFFSELSRRCFIEVLCFVSIFPLGKPSADFTSAFSVLFSVGTFPTKEDILIVWPIFRNEVILSVSLLIGGEKKRLSRFRNGTSMHTCNKNDRNQTTTKIPVT